ncbi:hypothetical protein GQ42DRAFT_118259 [Ramicandelaber brevisporus]|nr:hypothetical protein GQ42DRAFT_118259 [Ramicandelaber brevisporus]
MHPRGTCDKLRDELADCVLASPCVLEAGHTTGKCITDRELRETLPEKCQLLVRSFYECKRSLLDMRRRFRGPRVE